MDKVKKIEKDFHERLREGKHPLPPVKIDDIHRMYLQPSYTSGKDKYSDNKMAFHEIIYRDGGWKNKLTLDYGCGDGTWAVYFSLTGARKVIGFDLAEIGIRRGRDRIIRQGLSDKSYLLVGDASHLPFADDAFDIVIGTAVMHHVIKYPNIFNELYRVMKPKSKAYFLEGLADFFIWKIWWRLKGQVPQGDVPIFSEEIKYKSSMFSSMEIIGDTFLYSVKTFIWKPNMSKSRKKILNACKKIDCVMFKICPWLRKWGSFSYIILTK